jgi:hypothetical protein
MRLPESSRFRQATFGAGRKELNKLNLGVKKVKFLFKKNGKIPVFLFGKISYMPRFFQHEIGISDVAMLRKRIAMPYMLRLYGDFKNI